MTEEEKFALIPKEHLPLAMMLQQFQLPELVGELQTCKWYHRIFCRRIRDSIADRRYCAGIPTV